MIDPSSICQIELIVSDRQRAERFYLAVLGWKTVPVEILDYSLFDVPDHCPYGIALVSRAKEAESVGRHSPILHFSTQDLEKIKSSVGHHGGKVVTERFVPGSGRTLIFEDPDGNRLGAFEKDIGSVRDATSHTAT